MSIHSIDLLFLTYTICEAMSTPDCVGGSVMEIVAPHHWTDNNMYNAYSDLLSSLLVEIVIILLRSIKIVIILC